MKRMTRLPHLFFAALLLALCGPSFVEATTLRLRSNDISITPTFSSVSQFFFDIEIDELILPGRSYINPNLGVVRYGIAGQLEDTPSGFDEFNLFRLITESEFYGQGSSLEFEISPTANLSDGLQISELVPGFDGSVFAINAREVNTGRYHPPEIRLFPNGTGTLRNSNNTGGVNEQNGMVVNVDFGEEYTSTFTFDPEELALSGPITIPEPAAVLLLIFGIASLRIRSSSSYA